MTELIPERRKFLLAIANEELKLQLSQLIERHILHCQFFYANNGNEAISQFNFALPHVLITQIKIAKTDGLQLASWVIKERKKYNCGIIIIGEIPETEHFIDEVVDNQIQFFDMAQGELQFSKCVAKALSYGSQSLDHDFRLRFLGQGETLISEGEAADTVYLVKRGQLQATHTANGSDVLLGTIQPGEFVGEMSYINGEHRSADVKSLSDCELIEIPMDRLNIILFRKPAWAKALMKTLSKRLKLANETVSANQSKKDSE